MSRGRSTFFSTAAASAVFRGGRRRDARPGGGRLGRVVGTSQVFAETGRSMRARDLCEALDLPILPKNTEGIRFKFKRMVSRGILTEPEPGLFAQPHP